MAGAQDVDTLRRRGRRRLVGAVALALAAVVVLPLVFDKKPRRAAPEISVRIPPESEAPLEPAPAAAKPAPAKPAPAKPVPERTAPVEKPAAQFFVPVGAYSKPDHVIGKLTAAKLPYYTEAAPDHLTRVRAGPFASRGDAEKAQRKLKALGLKPGSVAERSG